MDGGAWQATAHGVAKSPTLLSDFTSPWVWSLLISWGCLPSVLLKLLLAGEGRALGTVGVNFLCPQLACPLS